MKVQKLIEYQFVEIISFIKKARNNTLQNVNKELITLYWNIGKYISKKVDNAEWGMSIVDKLVAYIQKNHPELKGYTRRNLYRMKQFYEIYYQNEKVSALLTQISWTNHLLVLSKTKTIEEKEFYLILSIKERYSSRELERQIDSAYFERTIFSTTKVSPLVSQNPINKHLPFKDVYILDFLNLPELYSEKDLRKALIQNFKHFLLEFGKDFAFIGEEYRIQVGNNDYFIDILFYHRELQCLVVFELKIDDFKPEHLGKLNFYLEALDRDVKKTHENPTVGIILCKHKNKEVVEYALNRNMSPALIAEYKTKLIPKKLLSNKFHELFELQQKNKNDI